MTAAARALTMTTCKSEYSTAKKAAGEKTTKKERSEAKKDAKKAYDECVEKAKHKS